MKRLASKTRSGMMGPAHVEMLETLTDAQQTVLDAVEDAESILATTQTARDVTTGARDTTLTARDATLAAKTATEAARDVAVSAKDDAEAAKGVVENLVEQHKSAWLGFQASDPTTDLNGDPLNGGETYVNSVSGLMRYYNGAIWQSTVEAGTPSDESVGADQIKGSDAPAIRLKIAVPSVTEVVDGLGEKLDRDANLSDLGSVVAALINLNFVGFIGFFAGATAPSGWLLCNGQNVSRSIYAALFAKIGTAHGAGDGSTTFTLPDLRGRVIAGRDDMGGSAASRLTSGLSGINGILLGAAGGAQTVTLTTAQIPSHTHGVWYGSGGTAAYGIAQSSIILANYAGAADSLAAGSGGAHNNTQPTIIMNACIFTGVN